MHPSSVIPSSGDASEIAANFSGRYLGEAKAPDGMQKIKFTEPRRSSGAALESCIQQRRSVRGFRDQALAEDELSQLMWSAQGVTGAEGMRAAPSAGALYPLGLYVAVGKVAALAPGAYHYLPRRHELLLVAPGDRREELAAAALGQEWIATAPAVVCIAAAFERTAIKYGKRGYGYVYIEAGHAAQSLMLQAVALGLATTVVGTFSDDEVKQLLHLGAEETPLCLIPVGTP